MLADIVRNSLGMDAELELFETEDTAELPELVRRLQAHVVILDERSGGLTNCCRELFQVSPSIKLLLLAKDAREAVVWELQPQHLSLGELSTSALRDLVRRLIPG
jgi:hypothetical protein